MIPTRRLAGIGLALFTVIATGMGRVCYGATEAIAVTPYRPSVSTPAALSAPGWLEGEIGGLRMDGGGDPRRESLPVTVKLAFTPDWGIRVGGEALVRAPDADGQRVTGLGDLAFVLKRRFAVNEQSAFGVELGVSSPTARPALNSGSGRTDYSINGIYSLDFSGLHSDMNLVLTRLGRVEPGQSALQQSMAVSLSGNVDEKWSLGGEVSGTRQDGAEHTLQLLVVATCTPRKSLALDFGAARGVSGSGPRWSVFAGATFLLGRVF